MRSRLQGAGFTHGEIVRVDLSGVRVGSPNGAFHKDADEPKAYFCTVGPIRVVEPLEKGDGDPLPEEVEFSGVPFSGQGCHRLENVIVRTNGRMRLEADDKTKRCQAGLLAHIKKTFSDAWRARARRGPTGEPGEPNPTSTS